MRTSNRPASGTVQSVDRAVTILELLAVHGTAGVTQLARELGVHKSTVSRLVAVLEARGFVEQLGDRGKYRLGFTVVRLANLAVLAGGAVLYVDQVSGTSTLSSYNWVGQHIPIHATSNGKVLVSEFEGADLTRVLGELIAYTPSTVTDRTRLDSELALVREQGFAIATDELDVGLTAVAAPVRDRQPGAEHCQRLGESLRVAEDRIAEIVPLVRTATTEISGLLAHVPPER